MQIATFFLHRFGSCVDDETYKEFLSLAKNDEIKKGVDKACGPVLKDLENTTEPRFIKTHLPFSLLPPSLLTCGAKVSILIIIIIIII